MNEEGIDEFLFSDLQKRVDTILIGSKMYQDFEQYWPSVRENSNSLPGLVEFAHWMSDTTKIVFSNILQEELNWNNSKIASADPFTTVQNLKKEPGGRGDHSAEETSEYWPFLFFARD
jgi:dihydrofolate reductase